MQQRKIIEDYLDSVIPQKISESTKKRLRAEIECHIYDRADFYMEIGYDEDAAFEKAIEQMGEGEEVKTEFESLYNDSTVKGVLWFVYISAFNLISAASSLGYWFLDHNHWTEDASVAELFIYLCNLVFIVTYTVKYYRQNLYKQLKGITFAFVLMAIESIVISGMFFPVFYAGEYVISYIINSPLPESGGFVFIANMIGISVFAFVLFLNTYGKSEQRKKPYLLSLKQITAILSTVCACFLVLYGFAFAKYEFDYDLLSGSLHSETPQEEYLPNITAEQKTLYAAIKCGDDAAEIEKILTANGFEKYSEGMNDYRVYEDFYYFLNFAGEDMLSYLKKNINGNFYSLYCYTNIMQEEDEYDDVTSCIIVSYDKNGKISYKMFIPALNTRPDERYRNYSHGEEIRKWFDNLKKGENTEQSLEFIRSVGSCIIEDERYDENNTSSAYSIEVYCYYNLEPTFIDLIFNRTSGFDEDYYNFAVKAENGIITDFKEIDWYN